MKSSLCPQILTVFFIVCLIVSCGNEKVKQVPDNSRGLGNWQPTQEVSTEETLVPISQYPMHGEEIDKKFILVFNKKVAFPPGIPANEYIVTEPQIKGFVSCEDNRLVFHILQPLPREAEEIKFCVNPQLQTEEGMKINPNNLCYQFPVKGLKVLSGNFKNVTESSFLFSIKFTHPVSVEDIKSFVTLHDCDNTNIPFEIRDTENQLNVDIHINRTGKEPYCLTILPGYMDKDKKYKGDGAYFEFPQKNSLEVVHCKINDKRQVEIVFSRPITSDIVYKFVKINTDRAGGVDFSVIPADWGSVPEIAFDVVDENMAGKSSKAWLIRLNRREYEMAYLCLTVAQYAWSVDNAILPQEYKWETKFANERDFNIYFSYWKNNGLDGVSLIVNMPKVNLETVKDFLEITPPVENLSIQDSGWEGLEIKGNWKSGAKYILKWKAGLQWNYREDSGQYKNLEKDYVYTINEVPEFKTLDFANKEKFYIIPYHEKNFIRVGSRNVPKGYIHIYQVITDNLSVWLGNISENSVPFEINERSTKYVTAVPVEFPDSRDKASYVDVDLTDYLSNLPKGIFTLCLSDRRDPGKLRAGWEPAKEGEQDTDNGDYEWGGMEYDYYPAYSSNEDRFYQETRGRRSAIRYILWTRLGVISHWNDTGLVVFVHDLLDLSPQAGAIVSAYSLKNYKVAEGVTDEDGLVKISLERQDLGSPRLLTIKTDKDFSFVFLKPKTLPTLKDLEKFDSYDKERYEAFMYADRNLYRPGETIHSRWIVRTNYGVDVVTAPLELRVINPQNKVISRKVVNLSEWGTGGEDIPTEFTYLTGKYTLGLYVPGGEKLCGSLSVYIEDFVPDRIKTELIIPEEFWVVGEEQKFEISSKYYVGPPAGDLPCKGKLIITPTEFQHENWKGYRFGNDELLKTIVMDLGSQKTDAEGKSTFAFKFSPPEAIKLPVDIAVVGEVSEAGGRAVSSVKKIKGYPENILCGVGMEQVNDKLQVSVALVDKSFAPAPDEEVEIYLEKVEWRYTSRVYSGNRVLPQWERFFTLIEQKKVTTQGGKATVLFDIPPYYSTYRVRAQRTNGKVYSETSFYCTPQKIMNVKSGPPELVKIHVEDKKWIPGEVVPVNVEVPFDGKAIMVVQGDKVWDIKVTDIVSGKGGFNFEVKEEFFPNVWVGVSAIHVPTKEETISPYSTFSFTRVDVEIPERRLNIAMANIPEQVKPQSSVEFDIQTTDSKGNPVPSELTVAVVDEGIHSILGYTLPNPYDWFGRPRYSPIRRVHYYENVAYDYDPLSPAGDMIARQLSAGKPEIGETWIKPLALWSGTIKTDDKGFTKVSFTFPEFNGTVRIVVVGVNKDLVGSAENKMFVRRPCVIQTHLPRFLRPQDKAIIFGRGLNSLEKPLDVNLTLIHGDEVQIEPGQLQWEAIPQALSFSPEMVITCLASSGSAKLNWQYNIVDKTGNVVDEFSEQTAIPIYLPSIYEQNAKSYVVQPGKDIQLNTSDYLDNPLLETEIRIGGSPYLQIEPALKWLWNYSYGCCEQKVSRLHPLYIFRNFMSDTLADTISKENYDGLLMTLVDGIFAHQQTDGGFSLWPYGGQTDLKTSLHVAFLLTLIQRDKVLPLPERPYKRMLGFLQDVIARGDEVLPDSGQYRAFATSIMALNGDPVACERIGYMLEGDYPRNLKVLLLMTADICGKPKEIIKKHLQTLKWETEMENKKCAWEFSNSEIRKSALKLISKILGDETPESIYEGQKTLIDYLSNSSFFTTYDLSMVLLALDMSFKKLNIKTDECIAEVIVDGESQTIQGTKILHRKKQGPANISILNKGNTPLFVSWTIRGVPVNPPQQKMCENMLVSRTIWDASDKKKVEGGFEQGKVYLITHNIQLKENIDNLILTQLLPAGFEVENPRLKREQLGGIEERFSDDTNLINPEHVEVRDDKIIVAFPPMVLSTSKSFSYIFAVRAITKGTYEFPGAYLEDMYEPEISVRLATEKIEIK